MITNILTQPPLKARDLIGSTVCIKCISQDEQSRVSLALLGAGFTFSMQYTPNGFHARPYILITADGTYCNEPKGCSAPINCLGIDFLAVNHVPALALPR